MWANGRQSHRCFFKSFGSFLISHMPTYISRIVWWCVIWESLMPSSLHKPPVGAWRLVAMETRPWRDWRICFWGFPRSRCVAHMQYTFTQSCAVIQFEWFMNENKLQPLNKVCWPDSDCKTACGSFRAGRHIDIINEFQFFVSDDLHLGKSKLFPPVLCSLGLP